MSDQFLTSGAVLVSFQHKHLALCFSSLDRGHDELHRPGTLQQLHPLPESDLGLFLSGFATYHTNEISLLQC